MANPKGNPASLPRGRLPGTTNKTTRDLREMILASLDKAGGLEYLVKQSEANPGPYMALLAKVLPKEVSATVDMRAYICAPEQAASMEQWAASVSAVPDDVPSRDREGD